MINPFFERILALEGPGGPTKRLSVVAPSVVAPGESFTVRLAALDELGFPSVECDAPARPLSGLAQGLPAEERFQAGRPAVAEWSRVVLREPGFHRLAVEFEGRVWRSNPIRCVEAPRERLYWGDPHVHTILSRCHWERCRTLNFCYVCARYVSGLDWAAAADHVSNGRGDESKWKVQREMARLFDDPPRFAALLAYEASLKGGAGGDNNVYFADDAEAYVDAYEDGDTRTLMERLGDQEFIIVPHHTTRTGKHGELNARTYLGPERMPVLEIHSKWGTSEYRGNPNALHQIHPGPSYAQDLLAQGCAFGFIAGTDTHATMPSGFGNDAGHIDRLPGLTAARAPALSRRGVFDALHARNCYAASLERIYVDARVAGFRMGADAADFDAAAPRRVQAVIAAESDITRVDVVRNGRDVHSQPGDGWRLELDWTDDSRLADAAFEPTEIEPRPFVYYYLRVTCASGAQAWTSPVWFRL